MLSRLLLRFAIGFFLVASLSGISFCSSSEDEVADIYKSYLREKNACATYDDYDRVNIKYASQGKLARTKLPKMRNASEGLRQSIFGVIQATMFNVSELVIKKVDIKGGLAVVHYTRKSRPELVGRATLVKEAGSWKIEEDTLKEN